jgi:hypothetical protein
LVGVLLGLLVSTVLDAVESCGVQSVAAVLADGLASSFVFVVGGDVADRGMQPDRVVLGADPGEFGVEFAGVGDPLQVRVLSFHVPEQRLDPGLIGGGMRAPEALGDVTAGEELPRGVGPHLRTVQFLTAVKCCAATSSGSCWSRNGRCFGARGDSCRGPLVASGLAGGGCRSSAAGSGGRGDAVAVVGDLAALLFGDLGAVGVAQYIGGVRAHAGCDPGQQDGGDRAECGVVVFSAVDDEPVVAGCLGGVDTAGVVGAEEECLAQASIPGFGWAASSGGDPGAQRPTPPGTRAAAASASTTCSPAPRPATTARTAPRPTATATPAATTPPPTGSSRPAQPSPNQSDPGVYPVWWTVV